MSSDIIARNNQLIDSHFHSEAQADVEAALATFTDDVLWQAPAPNGLNREYKGKQAAGENYRKLWASMANVRFTPIERITTNTRVVDDCHVTFDVIKDGYWHFPKGSHVTMRLVHIFEIRNGKIARETVFDMGKVG